MTLFSFIQTKLSSSRDRKATGSNSIPIQILKEFKNSLSEPLASVIDLSSTTGVFPIVNKTAKGIYLYQKFTT